MRTSKLFVAASAILFLFAASLSAQQDSVSYKSQVQFHLVNGYSLSYLNSLSNSSALRYKLDFYFSVGNSNSDGSYSSSSGSFNGTSSNTGTDNSNNQMLSFIAQYLWYPLNESSVRIFMGTGPFLSLNRYFSSSSTNNTPQNGDSYSNESTYLRYSLSLGIYGNAGVEVFLTKRISLIGEYGVSASYGWSKQKNTGKEFHPVTQYKSESNSESNSNGWNIGIGNLRLGVAFRF